MGYYIETGSFKGKANWILNHCQESCSISGKPKQWLLIKIEDAVRLNPKVKDHINWSRSITP